MANIKKVLLSKKIGNVVYDIFPKTSADVVVYGESTVAAALAEFAAGLADVYTKEESDAALQAESTALYNKIMGITEEDGATVKEAYDTLKEVAAWIDEHGEIAAAFTTDIAALKTAVGDENSGLVKAMADAQAAIEANDGDIEALQGAVQALETAVGDAESGLVKAMADAQAAIEALEGRADAVEGRATALEGRADALEGRADAVEGRLDAIEAIAPTKVEASETNGNIKIDGVETVVYTHPETHAATEIVEDDDHMFVTKVEKEAYARQAEILLVANQDAVVNEKDLYMVEIG